MRKIKRRKKGPLFPEFTSATLDTVREVLREKFAEIKKETGINIITGNIRYTEFHFSMKIEGILPKGKTKLETDYEVNAKRFNLPPLETKMQFGGRIGEAKTVGLKVRASKYPVIVESNDGKRWKLPIVRITQAM